MTDDTEPATGPFSAPSFRFAALFLLGCVTAGALILLTGNPDQPTGDSDLGAASAGAEAAPTSVVTPSADLTSITPTNVPTTTAAPPATPMTPSAPAGDATSVCGLPAGEQSIPMAAPSATWQIVGGRIAAPSSPVFGPAVVSAEGVGGCFAHSPTGALFAMMQSVALTAAAPDQIPQVAVVEQRGSRTNLFDTALAEAHREDVAAATGMPSEASTTVQQTLLGYTFIDYAPDRATIAVAVGIGDPSTPRSYQPSMFTGVVLWESGDWRFVYSAQTAGSMAPILSQGQYTRWAA